MKTKYTWNDPRELIRRAYLIYQSSKGSPNERKTKLAWLKLLKNS